MKLNNSVRNSNRLLSETGINLMNDMSHDWYPGPRTMFRPAFPNPASVPYAEAGGSANAQVLKNVPGRHGVLFGFPTRSGRCCPSEFEKLPFPSVTVNQLPL